MISKAEFVEEFADLAATAGIDRTCRIDFPDYMSERHHRDGRSYAEVDPYRYKFAFAIEVLELPEAHRRGLIMHEIGHVLCPEGTEREADRAAEEVFGERIEYDCGWPGKGLQCVTSGHTKNPPYSGYDKTYYQKPLPKDPTKIAYKSKRDALNVFIDWNRAIIDDYGGADMKHSPESFEAINHRFDIQGKRRVDTIAKALWWALPPGSPYYLEDIDVELLNRTAPAIYNTEGRAFSIPDYAEERRLLEQEAEHWERYRDLEYPEDDLADVPF